MISTANTNAGGDPLFPLADLAATASNYEPCRYNFPVQAVDLSSRVARLGPSPTLEMAAKARALKESGVEVISFAAGEPDLPTPEPVRDAAIEALQAGFTKYTPTPGIKELREKISEKLANENGVNVTPEQIVVSCGAKHSVFNALMALLEPGDETVIPAPYWMTYAEQVTLAGGNPVLVHSDAKDGFQPDPALIREAITKRTKAIVLNTPCNPTGAVFPRETIRQIADIAVRNNLWIIADEIYEKLVYEGEHVSPASLGRDVLERTVTVNGCSKSFSMTGWRIGYSASPLPVAKAIANFQDQVTSNPTSFAQKGALKAFSLPPQSINEMREEYRARRDLMLNEVREIPGVRAHTPSGAFYLFVNFEAYLNGRIDSDKELAAYLLDEAHVATVPGSVFAGPGHLRLSYASPRNDITTGIRRIAAALEKLGP